MPRSEFFKPWEQCETAPECHPGTVVSLGAFWSGFDIRNGLLSFDGQTYKLSENGGASAGVAFSGSFIAPPLAPSAVLAAPFRLVPAGGSSAGSSFMLPYPDHPPLTFLTGAGTATVNLSPWGPAFPEAWGVDSVRYDFSPVPEPGTVVMIGLCLAGVARRVSRRRVNA